jgi:hypothetical protein
MSDQRLTKQALVIVPDENWVSLILNSTLLTAHDFFSLIQEELGRHSRDPTKKRYRDSCARICQAGIKKSSCNNGHVSMLHSSAVERSSARFWLQTLFASTRRTAEKLGTVLLCSGAARRLNVPTSWTRLLARSFVVIRQHSNPRSTFALI